MILVIQWTFDISEWDKHKRENAINWFESYQIDAFISLWVQDSAFRALLPWDVRIYCQSVCWFSCVRPYFSVLIFLLLPEPVSSEFCGSQWFYFSTLNSIRGLHFKCTLWIYSNDCFEESCWKICCYRCLAVLPRSLALICDSFC